MATKRPSAVVTQRLRDAGRDRRDAAEPVTAMPRKALMMPITVPNSPMNGAVVAMVASEPTPFLKSEAVISVSRSMARRPASTLSAPESGFGPEASSWNSVSPARVTRARWLAGNFLDSARASSTRSLTSACVTARANSSDCFFALR